MNEAMLSILLLWTFVLLYGFAGAFDFGAGFWSMVYSKEGHTMAGKIANHYLSPSWEVTNVFLVMFAVALISFFPNAVFTLGTVLLIPGSLILILLLIRTAFLVFANSVEGYRKILNGVSGITGLLIPALLIAVLPISHGGYIELINGYQQLSLVKVFTSPSVFAFIGLAVSTTLYLSALLLADYARVIGDNSAVMIYRKNAKWSGPFTILFGILVIITSMFEASWLYEGIMERYLWLLASIIAFVIAYVSLWAKKAGRITLIATVTQYLTASYAYGAAHLPYLVYPATIEESFTNLQMYNSLISSHIIGTIILIPVLFYHWRLFMGYKKPV